MSSNIESNSTTNIDVPSSTTTNETDVTLTEKLETLSTNSNDPPAATNGSDPPRYILKAAKNYIKNLTDSDPQKNLLTLAIKLAESQDQMRLAQLKVTEIEKRSVVYMRERDLSVLENGRTLTAKATMENLCRELHRHNQQIRDESVQRQQDDEAKRRELATKFQTTIDDITSQLSNYSEKSNSLREQNLQLSEELKTIFQKYELREQEVEAILKKKEVELRLTQVSLEQSNTLNKERTELIKQEREIIEAERVALYKKCEELAASELNLRSQLTVYGERYQDFQNAIQQSTQMITSCQGEMEKMGKKIKQLEKERNEIHHRWEIAEQNQKKSQEDMKLMEKEKKQLEGKLDKLDKLCRVLQQERGDLQNTIKNLTKSASSEIPIKENKSTENEVVSSSTINDTDQSPNLYDSELGRIAKTVD